VIELLGVGVADGEGRWLLRGVCTEVRAGEVTAVVSRRREERAALLDAAGGHRIPVEGRVWVARIPLMWETAGRIRTLVAQARGDAPLAAQRSVTWNVLAMRGPFGGLLRIPRRGGGPAAARVLDAVGLATRARDRASELAPLDRARLHIARALLRGPRGLIIRDLDGPLSPDEGRALMSLARTLSRAYRLALVAGIGDPALAHAGADRVLGIADGCLVYDESPARFAGAALAAGICA
jgi:phosphonate transport system ATP-binding protein